MHNNINLKRFKIVDGAPRVNPWSFWYLYKLKIIVIFSAVLFSLYNMLSIPSTAFAAGDPSEGLGCGGGLGPIAIVLCGATTGEIVGERLNILISGIIGFMTLIAGLWFIFQFLRAGYRWIGAGGDKTAVETAIATIRNSLIGLIVVVGAWVIVGVIGKMVGLDILNPGQVIQTLGQ